MSTANSAAGSDMKSAGAEQIMALALLNKTADDFPGFISATMSDDWQSVRISSMCQSSTMPTTTTATSAATSERKYEITWPVPDDKMPDAVRIFSGDATAISAATKRAVAKCLGCSVEETVSFLRDVEKTRKPAKKDDATSTAERLSTKDLHAIQNALGMLADMHTFAMEKTTQQWLDDTSMDAEASHQMEMMARQREMENIHMETYSILLASPDATPSDTTSSDTTSSDTTPSDTTSSDTTSSDTTPSDTTSSDTTSSATPEYDPFGFD